MGTARVEKRYLASAVPRGTPRPVVMAALEIYQRHALSDTGWLGFSLDLNRNLLY